MRKFFSSIVCLGFIFCIASSSFAMSRFFLDYAVVDHSLKNDQGYSKALLKLYEKDPNAAEFIANFWHKRAYYACEKRIKEAVDSCVERITSNMTEEQKNEILKPVDEIVSNCFDNYYYDHWDKINKMLVDKFKAEGVPYRRWTDYVLLFFLILLSLFLFFFYQKKILLNSSFNNFWKKSGKFLLVVFGLFLVIGGLVTSQFNLLDFCFNPAGLLGIVLLIWAYIIICQQKAITK